MSAWSLAPHSEQKQLVTFRKMTQGRMACSEPLLVGGTSRWVTNTNKFCRNLLIMRWSFSPSPSLRRDAQKFVESVVEFGGIAAEGGIGQFLAATADGTGLAQELGQRRREGHYVLPDERYVAPAQRKRPKSAKEGQSWGEVGALRTARG